MTFLRRAWATLGRRGTALLFFAVLDFVYAYSLWDPPERSALLVWYAHVAPLKAWAALWFGVGVVLLSQAFRRNDKLAFACAAFLKLLWGIVAAIGGLSGSLPRGYVSATIWICAAAWVGVIASWPEPGADRTTTSSGEPRPWT